MTETIETIPASAASDGVISYEPSWSAMIKIEKSYRISTYKRILLLIIVCSAICYVAGTAQAQELFSLNLMPSPTGITSGRWALETPATAMAPAPSIQISTLNSQFRPSGFSQTLAADPRRNHPTEKADSSTADLGRSGLATETQQTKFGSFAYDDSMHQESFLSFVQTEYLLRESRLGDSQSLTSVSAISAYPLLQINYAGWNLPVTLYNPSSKASEARW